MPHAHLNGIDLHWNERGTGPVVLFLHGFPFHRDLWDAELAALPHGWRGLAPDLRGFGASRDHGHGPLSMEQHADDMIALLDQLQVDRAVVCGLSMGGYVSLALLARARERVRALVLCNTRAEPDGPEARQGRLETAERARREGGEAVVDGLLPKLLAESTAREHPAVVERLRAIMDATPGETIARASLGMAERQDARPLLAGLDIPTLVIGGEHDQLMPPAVLEGLAGAIPGARLAMLPGAGHVSNLDNPAAFRAALHGFLAALPA